MNSSWLLRWDTGNQEKPEVVFPEGDGGQLRPNGSPRDLFTDGESFAVFDGYLFDKTRFSPEPDAQEANCIACAYSRYGDGFLDELRGGFALAVWDGPRKRLIAGRDAMGLRPCYYCWDGRLLLLSPDLDRILAQPEVDGRFNRLLLAEYVLDIWHNHQRTETFYEQVQRLPSAYMLTLVDGKLTTRRYWNPLPPGFAWATREEVETYLSLLNQAVERCLAAGGDSLSLSGGFDSVSIAALAAEQLQEKRPLHAISLRFSPWIVDEGETQMAVARTLGMPQILRTIDECLDGRPYVEASLALSKSSPTPVLSPWELMYTALLETAAKTGLHRLLMGTGGDEMFDVDLSYAADRLEALDLRGLWRFYRAMARSSPFSSQRIARVVLWDHATKPVVLHSLASILTKADAQIVEHLRRRRLTPPAWIAPLDPELREALLHRLLNPVLDESAAGEGAYVRMIREMPQAPLLMVEIEQGASWAKNFGFTLLYPYFDRDLVDLALRIHPNHLIAGGRAKAPLRRLVAERLPAVNLPKKKVDFTRPAHELLRYHGRPAWRELGQSSRLEELGIVAPQGLNPLIEGYFAGDNQFWLLAWQALSAEAWLQSRVI